MAADAPGTLRGIDVLGAVAGGAPYFSGICSVGSKLYAAPKSTKMLEYDITSSTVRGIDVSTVPTDSGSTSFMGICSVGTKVYAAPFGVPTLLEYDTSSDTVRGIDVSTVAPGVCRYWGICCAGSKLYAAPHCAAKLLEYDIDSGTVRGIDISTVATGDHKFAGICCVGSKVYAAPSQAAKMLEYDTSSGTVRGIDISIAATGSWRFNEMCVVGSKLYAAPRCAEKMLEYDTSSGTVRGIDISTVPTGYAKFLGICSIGSKVYASPCNGAEMLEYDTSSGTVRGIDVSTVATEDLSYKFFGMCSVGSQLFAAPHAASKLLVYEMPSVEDPGGRPSAHEIVEGASKIVEDAAESTRTSALEAKLASLSKENERQAALISSQSKELERMAAASHAASAAGSGAAAARSGRHAEGRLAELEGRLAELKEVLAGLHLSGSILDSGASFAAWLAQQGFSKEQKFEATMLTFGRSAEAAGGLEVLLGVDDDTLAEFQQGGLGAMRSEFAKNGDKEDNANFRYVVDGIALEDQWMPEHVKADIKNRKYHGGSLEPGDYDMNHAGYTLKDFVATADARLANLKDCHVAALRLYTTNTFRKLNTPLRKRQRPHPFATTVYFLAQGLKKLRKVQAELDPEGFAKESELWRGMRNVTLDYDKFQKEGGTELAPMSTSTDRSIACKYAASESPLIMRYKVQGLTRGVSLKFLSVYPKEEEYLYPPGCFLTFQSKEQLDGFTVLTVTPQVA